MIIRVTAAAVVAALAASAGTAQTPGQPQQIEAMVACSRQSDDSERLRCYDAAVAALGAATAKGDIVVVEREDVRRTRRSLFGFTIPKLPFFRGDTTEEEAAEEIEAKIKRASKYGYNKWLVELDSGAVWQTTEAQTRQSLPQGGEAIRIKKGLLGSYTMFVDGGRGIRTIRIR